QCMRLIFFFQAEDGIRDATVTGVQTCALPICSANASEPANLWRAVISEHKIVDFQDGRRWGRCSRHTGPHLKDQQPCISGLDVRSEERRVGKEGRWEWGA